jgi:hypothetical protein
MADGGSLSPEGRLMKMHDAKPQPVGPAIIALGVIPLDSLVRAPAGVARVLPVFDVPPVGRQVTVRSLEDAALTAGDPLGLQRPAPSVAQRVRVTELVGQLSGGVGSFDRLGLHWSTAISAASAVWTWVRAPRQVATTAW